MLKFTEIFRRSSVAAPNAVIVGQETTGVILLTWVEEIDAGTVTHLSLYNIERKSTKELLVIQGTLKIIHATVNTMETLVSYTASVAFGRHSELAGFETFVSTVAPAVQDSILLRQSSYDHRTQFLHEETPQQGYFYLLFVGHNESITMYTVKTKQTSTGTIISDQQSLLSESKPLHESICWYQWDMLAKKLYFIAVAKGSDSSPKLFLKSLVFSSKSYSKIDLSLSLPLEPFLLFFTSKVYLHVENYHSLAQPCWNCEVVTMSGKALCICFQHPPTPAMSLQPRLSDLETAPLARLSFTVFMLHHSRAVTYNIDIPNLSAEELAPVRLNFGVLGDQLMVYSPGVALVLLDCGHSHEATHHLEFVGKDALLLPHQANVAEAIKSHVSYLDVLHRNVVRQSYDHTLFDTVSGIAYRPTFDFNAIAELSLNSPTKTVMKLIHLLVVHLQAENEVKHILRQFLELKSKEIGPAIFEEFMLSLAFRDMFQMHQDEITKLVPLSNLSPYSNTGSDNVVVALWPTSSLDASVPKSKLIHEHTMRCLRFNIMMIDDEEVVTATPVDTKPTSSPAPGMFDRLFKTPKKQAVATPLTPLSFPSSTSKIIRNVVSGAEHDRSLFRQSLERHFAQMCDKNLAPKFEAWAESYVAALVSAAKALFELVHAIVGLPISLTPSIDDDTISHQRLKRYFSAQEVCYRAFKHLHVPAPPLFQQDFAKAGYKLLTRRMFLQYVANDVFTLDENFVLALMQILQSPEEDGVFFELLQHLDQATASNVFDAWHHPYKYRFEVESKIAAVVKSSARVPQNVTADEDEFDLPREPISISRLPPLIEFLKYLQQQQKRIARANIPAPIVDLASLSENAVSSHLHGPPEDTLKVAL